MFNEQLKKEYVSSLHSARLNARVTSLFTVLEQYEDQLGKDIYSWDPDTLTSVFNDKYVGTYSTKRSIIRTIRAYMTWCETKGIQTAIEQVRGFELSVNHMADKGFANPDDLQDYLDLVFRPEEDRSPDNIYRAAMWLAYIGLDLTDAVLVKSSDYNAETNCISFDGTDIQLPAQAAAAFYSCKYDEGMYTYKPYRESGRVIKIQRAASPYLLRGQKRQGQTGNVNSQVIKNKIYQKECKAVESGLLTKQVGYTNVYLSGLFYRVYVQEKNGFPVRFDQELAKHNDSVRNARFRKQRLLADYEDWKAAFNL